MSLSTEFQDDEGDVHRHPYWTRRSTHAVWTLQYDGETGRTEWDTDGVPLPESLAVKEARTLKCEFGIPALALPLGKEPEQLHPAERPIKVVG